MGRRGRCGPISLERADFIIVRGARRCVEQTSISGNWPERVAGCKASSSSPNCTIAGFGRDEAIEKRIADSISGTFSVFGIGLGVGVRAGAGAGLGLSPEASVCHGRGLGVITSYSYSFSQPKRRPRTKDGDRRSRSMISPREDLSWRRSSIERGQQRLFPHRLAGALPLQCVFLHWLSGLGVRADFCLAPLPHEVESGHTDHSCH